MADRSERYATRQESPHERRLTPAEFATRFEEAWRALWFIAAAVLGEKAGADDVLQESAMVALSKLSQFDPDSNFTAWMGRIVRFVALNHARRRTKTSSASVDPHSLEVVAIAETKPLGPLVNGRGQLFAGHESFDDKVLAALRSLDETARACLLLRTLMDMPYREISLALDIAEGTAMSHVHRARNAMRQRLNIPAPSSGGHSSDSRRSHLSGDLESHRNGRE